jgi:hypothetical protein
LQIEITLILNRKQSRKSKIKFHLNQPLKELHSLFFKTLCLKSCTPMRIFKCSGVEIFEDDILYLKEAEVLYISQGEEFN